MSREAKLIEDSLRPWGEASAPRWEKPGPKTKAARCYLHVFACQAPMSQPRRVVVPASRAAATKQVSCLVRCLVRCLFAACLLFASRLPAGLSPEPARRPFRRLPMYSQHAEPPELAKL